MSVLEIIAVITSILYVILVAYQSSWCWLFSMISVVLYFFLCLDANLYFEAGLQAFYMGTTLYGWYSWKRISTSNDTGITTLGFKKNLVLVIALFILVIVSGKWVSSFTNATLPYLDAFTTWFSVVATIMVTRKLIENWIYWIVIDTVSIYLYHSRELNLTAGLFAIYTIVSVLGWIKWKKYGK